MTMRRRPSVSLPSRARLLLTALAIVFFTEFIAEGILRFLPRVPWLDPVTAVIINATLLALLVAPVLWWLTVRPLRQTATDHAQAAAVLAHAGDGIITLNAQGQVESVNPAAERIFGYDEKELVGKPVTLLMAERDGDAHQRELERVASGGAAHLIGTAVEVHGLRKDGTEFPMELTLATWKTGTGVFFTGIIRDITERKLAEDEIRSLARFPAENPNPVLRLNRDGRIVYANDACEALLQGWGCAVGGSAPAPWPETVREAIASQSSSVIDVSCETLIYSFFVAPIPGAGCVNLYGHDITERRRTEGTLQETHESLRALIQASPLAIAALDPEGKVTMWNPAAERMFGWCEPEVLGRPFPIVPAEKQEEFRALRQRVLQGEVLAGVEVRRQRKDGAPIDIGVWAAPLCDAHNGTTGVMSMMADITDRKQAEDALVERTRQLEAVRAVTEEITRELDLRAVLDLIMHRAVELVGVSEGMLRLWDEGASLLVPQGWVGLNDQRGAVGLRLGEGVAGTAAERRQGLIENDFRHSPYATPVLLEYTTHTAVLAEPLLYRDRLVGVINLNREGPAQPFTEKDRQLLALFAAQAAIAIENARLYEAEQERRKQLEAVRAVTTEITRELDLTVLLELITRRATELVGAVGGMVRLWDEATQTLVPRASYRMAKWLAERPVQVGEGMVGTVAQRREGMIVNDFRTSAYATPLHLEKTTHSAALAEPLLYRDRLVGVILLTAEDPGRAFTEQDRELLALFAAQAAIAIENARLHENAQRRAREATALAEVGRILGSSLDPDRVLDLIVQEVQRVMGATFAGIMTLDEPGQVLTYAKAAGLSLEHLGTIRLRVGEGLAGLALAQRTPIQSSKLHEDPRYVSRDVAEKEGFRSLLCVPLLAGSRPLGILTVFRRDEREFSPAEVELLSNFANQASLALENARLYAEVQDHSENLEEKIADRTRELEEMNLELAAASRHKSEFLANMSHELRTPLNSIIGFSELLQGQGFGPLTERQTRYVGHIHQSGKHLLQLISDILDLSKVEAGKLVLQLQALPVPQTLEDILVIARGLAHKKDQQLVTHIAPDLPPLTADPLRFKQILFNLLSNAVKFTPDGGRITLAARRVAGEPEKRGTGETESRGTGELASPVHRFPDSPIRPSADCLEIQVSDTGIGIKVEDLPRLFHEFVQLEPAFTKRHEGTGLGLALTKRLVELHGGRIQAASEGQGRGTAFTVLLPFGGPEDQANPSRPHETSPAQ